ncbi:DUF3097 family protein, partial [Streptomyces hirsutus]|uniref:DUF3097 family protein n=1 Tax=Streptomyces hirsutus TaxID=35620 RepID=UPI0036266F4B
TAGAETCAHAGGVGHPNIAVGAGVTPSPLGWGAGPRAPRAQDWKTGVCRALGWRVANTGEAWQHILGSVHSYRDLEPELLGRVEELIDFVTVPS